MRAGFMTLTFHKSRCDQDGHRMPTGTVVVLARFEQLNVKAWLIAGI